MAWTKVIGPAEAQGELRDVYNLVKSRKINRFPEFLSVYTQEPGILHWLIDTFSRPGAYYGAAGIDPTLVELIVVAVSAANQCHNCVVIHGELLGRLTGDEALVKQVASDFRKADLDSKAKAALEYAVKLTLHPTEMKRQDVQSLKEAGFTDRQIVDIAHVAAWFNYVNRIAEGLGTELRQ